MLIPNLIPGDLAQLLQGDAADRRRAHNRIQRFARRHNRAGAWTRRRHVLQFRAKWQADARVSGRLAAGEVEARACAAFRAWG